MSVQVEGMTVKIADSLRHKMDFGPPIGVVEFDKPLDESYDVCVTRLDTELRRENSGFLATLGDLPEDLAKRVEKAIGRSMQAELGGPEEPAGDAAGRLQTLLQKLPKGKRAEVEAAVAAIKTAARRVYAALSVSRMFAPADSHEANRGAP